MQTVVVPILIATLYFCSGVEDIQPSSGAADSSSGVRDGAEVSSAGNTELPASQPSGSTAKPSPPFSGCSCPNLQPTGFFKSDSVQCTSTVQCDDAVQHRTAQPSRPILPTSPVSSTSVCRGKTQSDSASLLNHSVSSHKSDASDSNGLYASLQGRWIRVGILSSLGKTASSFFRAYLNLNLFSFAEKMGIAHKLYNPQLQSLEIAGIDFHNVQLGEACLQEFFNSNTSLENFSISWGDLSDTTMSFIAKQSPNLRVVSLVRSLHIISIQVKMLIS